MVRRASRIFFLDLMEQFSGHLEECFLVQTILPILPLYLDKPEFADVFGSTHSLILSLFSQNRECMIPVAVTYSSYLIEVRISIHQTSLSACAMAMTDLLTH